MHSTSDRRDFLKTAAVAAAAGGLPAILRTTAHAAEETTSAGPTDQAKPMFKISLAEWSLHRTLNGGFQGTITH